jgi:O-antigen ligase
VNARIERQSAIPTSGLFIALLSTVIAWLLPNHMQPWPAFFNEIAMALALLPLACWVMYSSAARVQVPQSALFVLLAATVPVFQWQFGQIRFSGDALLAVLYLVGLAACLVVGARWRSVMPSEAASQLFSIILIYALLSAGLALAQWLRIDSLGVLLADLPYGQRPTGNISQANHLATVLVWGLIGLWGLVARGDIRAKVALLAAPFLLFGLAMSQSRTAWLDISLMTAAALVWPNALKTRRYPTALFALLLLFVVLVVAWPHLNDALYLSGERTLGSQMEAGTRPGIWLQMVKALTLAPWFGYGWTQVSIAQQAVALQLPFVHESASYAHNIWLDLMVWNGLPLGLVFSLAIIGWFFRRFRQLRNSDDMLLFVALLALLVHAQLEYPHAYAYFLLPAGLMAGMLSPASRTPGLRRWALAVPIVGLGCWLFALTGQYASAEAAWRSVRFEKARIGGHVAGPAPELSLLSPLAALLDMSKVEPQPGMPAEQQAKFQLAVERFPSPRNLYQLAVLQARNEKPIEAAKSLTRLCAISNRAHCSTAASAWRAQSENDLAMRSVLIPGDLKESEP